MVVFPNAKINLGLNVVRKRPDGFHDIETLMYPIPFRDVLEIMPLESVRLEFTVSGVEVVGRPENNLCVRAYDLVAADHKIPPVRMHLHKVIPPGSGLGGGSSDAAFTIRLLNDLFSIGLGTEKMKEYAGRLGSDCAFFIENRPAIATGRGEILEPSGLDLSGYSVCLVIPGVHVSTAEAYSGVTPKTPLRPVSEIVARPIREWKDQLRNDFEETVFVKYPRIGSIKEEFYKEKALYASMSGSGSAVYGILEKAESWSRVPGEALCWRGDL